VVLPAACGTAHGKPGFANNSHTNRYRPEYTPLGEQPIC